MQGQTTLVSASLFLAFFCLASGTTDVATPTALIEVQRDNAELKRDNAELKRHYIEVKRHFAEVKRDNAELKRHYTEVKRHFAEVKRHLTEVKRDNAELRRHYTEVTNGNAEVKKDNVEVKKDNAELKKENAEVKKDNLELKKEIGDLRLQLTGARAVQVRQSMTSCGHNNSTTSASGKTTSGGGATYIRWGRTSCPNESILVYKGYVGGGHYSQTGAATNHVCLPEDPHYTTTILPEYYAEMWGAEYQTYNVIFRSDIYDQDIPCAVCRSPTRSSAIMIPAKTSCYPSLHLEYFGYLMASHRTNNAGTEYICVDGNPEAVHGGVSNQDGNVLHFTVSRCGSLKCPPYIENRVLSCVVCSQ